MADLRETFLYFAYGSNMLTRRLSARTPSAVPPATAYVDGYRLTFDKVSTDGSGKCDIEATRNAADRVWGVLFRIATAEAADLDDAEGLGQGYRAGEERFERADRPDSIRTEIYSRSSDAVAARQLRCVSAQRFHPSERRSTWLRSRCSGSSRNLARHHSEPLRRERWTTPRPQQG